MAFNLTNNGTGTFNAPTIYPLSTEIAGTALLDTQWLSVVISLSRFLPLQRRSVLAER
jgi:hypothetical protein